MFTSNPFNKNIVFHDEKYDFILNSKDILINSDNINKPILSIQCKNIHLHAIKM